MALFKRLKLQIQLQLPYPSKDNSKTPNWATLNSWVPAYGHVNANIDAKVAKLWENYADREQLYIFIKVKKIKVKVINLYSASSQTRL